jgi:hypothetical protein
MARGIRSEKSPDVTVYGVSVLRESEKAILIKLKSEEELWLPKSQLREGGTAQKKGDTGTVVMSAWIAGEKGLKDGNGLEEGASGGPVTGEYDDTWAGGYDD